MDTVFIERKNEQQRLEQLLEQTMSNSLQMCFVTGERGDGKTTLVEHFVEEVQKKYPSVSYAIGSCQEITMEKSYEPFQDLFSQLTGLRAKELRSAVGLKQEFGLKDKIEIATHVLVNITPDLINTLVPGVALLTRVVGVGAQRIIQRRIEASKDQVIVEDQLKAKSLTFFTELSKKNPLILVFDDVQWFDSASFKLLQYLESKLRKLPIMIILTYRSNNQISEEMKNWIAEITPNYGDVQIELQNTTEENAKQFIAEFLKRSLVHINNDQFIEEFYKRTQGKPLYAIEFLNYLVMSEILEKRPHGFYRVADGITWSDIPSQTTQINTLIDNRLRLIDKECTEILQIASVEGHEFTAQVINELLPNKSEIEVLETLTKILDLEHGLVKELEEQIVGTRTISRFRFTNILYQERIYNSMPTGVRRIRHDGVAKALEELHSEDLEQITLFLAQHYESANNPGKASEYLIKFGKHQLTNRNDEGINTLQRALVLSRTAKHVKNQVDSLRLIGTQLIDKVKVAELDDVSERYFEPAIKLAEEHKLFSELSDCLRSMGRIKRRKGSLSEAMYHYMEALNIAKQQNDRDGIGAALNNIGVLAKQDKRFTDAMYFYQQRLKIAEEDKKVESIIIVCGNLAAVTRLLGEFRKAREYLDQAYKYLSQREDWLRETGVMIEQIYLETAESNLKKASELLLDVIPVATEKDHNKRVEDSYLCAADIFSKADSIELAVRIIRVSASDDQIELARIRQHLLESGVSDQDLMRTDGSVKQFRNEVEALLRQLASV